MAANKAPKPKVEMTVEQMQAKMQQALEQERNAFLQAYKALCEKHGFQMVPEMVLKAGEAPRVTMYPDPLNKG